MNRRIMKVLAVVAVASGLTGLVGATAWAETFQPAIEEPTADLSFLDAPLLGGTTPEREVTQEGEESTADGETSLDETEADSGQGDS